MAWVRDLVKDEPRITGAEIAGLPGARLKWYGPGGRPRALSARLALLRLAERGLVELPPPRTTSGRPCRVARRGRRSRGARGSARWTSSARSGLARSEAARDSALWNAAVSRYHDPGDKPLAGAELRSPAAGEAGLLGLLDFGAAAWRVAARDWWIGWSPARREARLPWVAQKAGFPILPWIRRRLASRGLARAARHVPADWERRYGYRPALLETLVKRGRFRGRSYRAANRHPVGFTGGRGKLERRHRHALPVKEVFGYPLAVDFREVLCRGAPPRKPPEGAGGHGRGRSSAGPHPARRPSTGGGSRWRPT